jgi:hypothetical protein
MSKNPGVRIHGTSEKAKAGSASTLVRAARVTLHGKTFCLGKYKSPEAELAYDELICEWRHKTGRFTPPAKAEPNPITVEEVWGATCNLQSSIAGSLAKTAAPWDLKELAAKQVGVKTRYQITASLRLGKAAAEFTDLDHQAAPVSSRPASQRPGRAGQQRKCQFIDVAMKPDCLGRTSR